LAGSRRYGASFRKDKDETVSASDNDRLGELLIQEVDEELRHEQYQKLWKRYGNWAIAGAIAVVLAVAGYQGWQTWQSKLRQREAAQFDAAARLVADGKTQDAIQAMGVLEDSSRTGYALAAGMARASMLADGGDVAGALATYEKVASSSAPRQYRDLAVIKAALLALDAGDPASYEQRITDMTTAGNAWHYSATEILAMMAQKKGDTKRAIDLYKQIADDSQAPRNMRARATEMLAALGGSGSEGDVGGKPATKDKG
jgi:hypothetical protein